MRDPAGVAQARRELRRRTEMQLAAEVVIELVHARMLRFDSRSIARIAAVTRVPVPELRAAHERRTQLGYQPPTGALPTPVAAASPTPPPAPGHRAPGTGPTVYAGPLPSADAELEAALARYPRGPEMPVVPIRTQRRRATQIAAARSTPRYKAKNPEPGVRICSRCNQPKPLDAFNVKRRREGAEPGYMSMCRDCQKAYSRERYLNVERLKGLAQAGISFVIGPDDDVEGLECTGCHGPLEEGETVIGWAELTHERCVDG